MRTKTEYTARVFDKIKGKFAEIEGTNKETLLRNAAKIARENKTRQHWKNDIKVYVNLYCNEDLKKDLCSNAIKTMSF